MTEPNDAAQDGDRKAPDLSQLLDVPGLARAKQEVEHLRAELERTRAQRDLVDELLTETQRRAEQLAARAERAEFDLAEARRGWHKTAQALASALAAAVAANRQSNGATA